MRVQCTSQMSRAEHENSDELSSALTTTPTHEAIINNIYSHWSFDRGEAAYIAYLFPQPHSSTHTLNIGPMQNSCSHTHTDRIYIALLSNCGGAKWRRVDYIRQLLFKYQNHKFRNNKHKQCLAAGTSLTARYETLFFTIHFFPHYCCPAFCSLFLFRQPPQSELASERVGLLLHSWSIYVPCVPSHPQSIFSFTVASIGPNWRFVRSFRLYSVILLFSHFCIVHKNIDVVFFVMLLPSPFIGE